ncbi:TPA: hypothetical protein DCZ15_00845 [Candidatus Falkowbacteria bacterium]|nr:MAG: hypothetical protein UV95_C0003G0030 [Candidatus Falkowbacteria bacterium GW2011_GWF2_43_32]HBA36402.1 hypothetical protein [Candidatus Falkowbacteria bacterium]
MKKFAILAIIVVIFTACFEERPPEKIDKFINNDLSFVVLINGQEIDTVYVDSLFSVYANVPDFYLVDYYEINLNDETFYDKSFYYSLPMAGRYAIDLFATNGGRGFKDTAEIYAIDYPGTTVWLPGLWGDNTDSARFRIGIDTLFFNAAFCPTRPLPFVIFADSVNAQGQLLFNGQELELLNFYREPWYYLSFNDLSYWLNFGEQEFLCLRYGGDYHNIDGSLADMRGGVFNEDLDCYVIQSFFLP